MTQETLDLIHRSYQEALEKSCNIIQIVENLYNILSEAEVTEEDSAPFDVFIDGLRNCLHMQKMTSDITDIITYITITIMHIIKWLNVSRRIDIDINLHGRRKSLESDLTKLLRKSTQTLSARIRDRFGLRGTLLNEPEGVAIEYIYLIHDAVVGILAGKNRKMNKEFRSWLEYSCYVNPVNKVVINQVLDIPFDVDDDSYKDYIKNKKANGYQSLHFTLTIQPYSHVIPGSQLEIQLRTRLMDREANTGSASHEKYKKYLECDTDVHDHDEEAPQEDNPLLRVFTVDDFSRVRIPGFTSYETIEGDIDGIHFSKGYATRRISYTLVPPTLVSPSSPLIPPPPTHITSDGV